MEPATGCVKMRNDQETIIHNMDVIDLEANGLPKGSKPDSVSK